MEQRISLITLGVADLHRSRDFYERLGWKRSNAKAEEIVFFQAGGMALALYPRVSLAKDANVSPDGEGFGGITLAYNTRTREEVDSVLAQAEAAGAKVLKPAQETFWGGYDGYFSDPDGFLWEVAWNPFFPIAEDGSIRIPAEVKLSISTSRSTGDSGRQQAPYRCQSRNHGLCAFISLCLRLAVEGSLGAQGCGVRQCEDVL